MKSFLKVFVVSAVFGLLLIGKDARAEEQRWALGDLGFDPIEYQATLKHFPPRHMMAPLPSSFDWRDYGVVTPAKDQHSCGSCWAFATVGCLESKIILAGGPVYNLSEQQQLSCNDSMWGCCGGYYGAFQYWYTNNPLQESCTHYGDFYTQCPEETTVLCDDLVCSPVPYRTANLYTINTSDLNSVKTSIYEDGPAYFSFLVYSDFFSFWGSGRPGDVYRQASGVYEGGHAVLVIGWDDAKAALLCKNSWGATGGPNRDGTFWIGWGGHANSLSFGMANCELSADAGLTQINLVSPEGVPTLSAPPTFFWTVDGGTSNVYAVDFSIPPNVPLWSTQANLHQLIYDTSWTMPSTIWNKIPSGKTVYWRVRGADLDVSPRVIVTSDEVRSFVKE